MERQEVNYQARRSIHVRTGAEWEHIALQSAYTLQMGRGIIFPTEIWLQITNFLSRNDLKYLALVSKFFRSLCIPSLSQNVRLLRRHIEEQEDPPKWLAGVQRLKLRDESLSGLIVDSKLARYIGINFFRSSLSVLSLVNIRLPRQFYYYLLMAPSIRHIELSRVTMDDSNTPPTLSPIPTSIFWLNPFRKKNEGASATIPDHLHALTLESLRVQDLDTSLLAEVLEATRKDKLLKLCMESPCQASRIFRDMILLQNITSLTLSWETREVHFPVMLFPRLDYLESLHSHVGAFLRRGHRVRTLKIKEFQSAALQYYRPPDSDLGSWLAPAMLFSSGLEPTLEGITTLHISIRGITCDWLVRLVSIVTRHPHVKDFSISADLMEASDAMHAFQLSINLLHQCQDNTETLERLCFSFGFLDNLEIDCRKKREAGDCEWDVRRTNARALEEWILVGSELTRRETGDVYYPQRGLMKNWL